MQKYMSKINGIYAAGMSIFNKDLSLNIDKTILHAENLIDKGCHGVAIFGSTGQAQLIPISEKIKLLNKLSKSKYKNNFIIGNGLNSLSETINYIKIALSLNFENFLIMPPAYYEYDDEEVITFYSKIVEAAPNSSILLYNFEKLCGYKFSLKCVRELVKKFPKQIIGIKDSSYNIYKDLKLKNFSILPGSETKLVEGLELGCSGVITATCNVTAELSRRVYDDFVLKKAQTENKKLISVRSAFDKYNLISGLHSYCAKENDIFRNVLPPLRLLSKENEKELFENLKRLNFKIKPLLAA